ncbi:MAG: hypothetical protein K9G59_05390 [Caulobacter sp.]|nr:hypothetical protein [Caulobacter sp.]
MEDLFRSYWWLMFPLAWFIMGGWQSWLNYRKHRDNIDIIKSYAASGREPPAGLLDKLNAPSAHDDAYGYNYRESRGRRGYGGWYQVVLFGSLAAGFGYAAATDIYEAGPAFVIVTFVMGALCLASLVATLTMRTPKD